ncbi:MAG TPA: hypothetical protein VMJ30_03195, partial [Gemmatimonadales bacterium]|nr:hypothetical protein [Gemmatimonadales bacterium]
MRDSFETGEGQKPGRALDGVNRAEDAGKNLTIRWVLLEFDEVTVEPVEVLVTLDQKFFDDVFGVAHSDLRVHRRIGSSLDHPKVCSTGSAGKSSTGRLESTHQGH